ncbi:unnamed protein product [Prorocentrum cordatum]|uniref:Uncharacterized protein n=1 Tax=Prorocentrum cordatum TaxID=2364126 RepID=A0ABN9SA81_9DINO|nr:unnamed protein product [Polarella glacialis]
MHVCFLCLSPAREAGRAHVPRASGRRGGRRPRGDRAQRRGVRSLARATRGVHCEPRPVARVASVGGAKGLPEEHTARGAAARPENEPGRQEEHVSNRGDSDFCVVLGKVWEPGHIEVKFYSDNQVAVVKPEHLVKIDRADVKARKLRLRMVDWQLGGEANQGSKRAESRHTHTHTHGRVPYPLPPSSVAPPMVL